MGWRLRALGNGLGNWRNSRRVAIVKAGKPFGSRREPDDLAACEHRVRGSDTHNQIVWQVREISKRLPRSASRGIGDNPGGRF